MTFTSAQIAAWVGSFLWPFMRIGAMFMAAPIFGTRSVPVRIRLVLALAVSWVLAPVIPEVPAVDPISAEGVLIALHQVLIGVAMGFVLQMVFNALIIGGQSIANSMGLGFASIVDPENGVQVPAISQYYLIMAMLVFLALNGHLVLLELLADSFRTLPVGTSGLSREALWMLVNWTGQMFAGAVLLALPAIVALLVVNLSFGVMTRAAPQLNIFAVGFPVTLLLGFLIVLMTAPSLTPHIENLTVEGFGLMRLLISGG